MPRPLTLSSFVVSLTDNDIEERRLLEEYIRVYNTHMDAVEALRLTPQKRQAKELERPEELDKIVSILGYMPEEGRAKRRPGRPRADAIPDPLPDIGTKLQAVDGLTYTIQGYARVPVHTSGRSVVLYSVEGLDGWVSRPLAHLLANVLPSGVPLVTWPDDPRGLKPHQAVPLGKQRTVTKKDLAEDRYMRDADQQQWDEGRHRRY